MPDRAQLASSDAPTSPPASIRAVVRGLTARFRAAHIEAPRAEAEWLVAGVLDIGRPSIYLHDRLAEPARQTVEAMAARRIAGEPLQYLFGTADFMGMRLRVAPGVLIPRPETECVAERGIRHLQGLAARGVSRPRALDLGTGSGAIAIAVSRAVPACLVAAVELSWDALQVATYNVATQADTTRLCLVRADWTSSIQGPFDVIISNPPYISTGELSGLPRHVRAEPRMALDGGADGLTFLRRVVDEAHALLAPGGAVCCECAADQANRALGWLAERDWVEVAELITDLSGRPCGVFARATD